MQETRVASRARSGQTTIFAEISAKAAARQAVNLGQGFPDFAGFEVAKEAAQKAIGADENQYAPMTGPAALRQAIANHTAYFYGQTVDAESEITVTHGATEGLFVTLQALVDPGDEVILFEPYYDSYRAGVELAGGVPVFLPLKAPLFDVDVAALKQAITAKTKLIILNTPHNPTGMALSKERLKDVGQVAKAHDLFVVVDEVYEHLTYDGTRHYRLAADPEYSGHVVTISSAGKTFSLTGWKIGWVIAPSAVSQALRYVHQFATFCGAAPLQKGIAAALPRVLDYVGALRQDMQSKRDFLCDVLQKHGLDVFTPKAGYFVTADVASASESDVAYCDQLLEKLNVAAIPCRAFMSQGEGSTLVRFAFCKSWDTLHEAARRLA